MPCRLFFIHQRGYLLTQDIVDTEFNLTANCQLITDNCPGIKGIWVILTQVRTRILGLSLGKFGGAAIRTKTVHRKDPFINRLCNYANVEHQQISPPPTILTADSAADRVTTLTADHRVVDGAVGAEFMATFKRLIENPLAMLL